MVVALAGCVGMGSSDPPVATAAVPAPAVGGPLGASLAGKVDDADRQAAFNAELDAVSAGERRSWRGPHGTYGYVDPGPQLMRTEGFCRQYTLTIYVGGRPQTGTGLACHQADGEWHVVS
ncbi:MAG: hypothetical protein JO366_05780 [Methylobacteriaceae bacterium]|nr:hypothetical protein [Methylobacteriaceae bacterium]MBV9244304.1 hypothetical protein [Methylobacteriaceae bacterium]MBV9636694.1 hypothetical protein [Methylobacteriaceae bacterium]MBV9704372.1 hypothetical protein [Methylobacteriaceae bacterium]